MHWYAKLQFVRHPDYKTQYVLYSQENCIPGLDLCVYKKSETNDKLGLTGMRYINFEVPRSPSIRKFFAHTFTMKDRKVLTSTEPLNEYNRTFGDTKNLGLTDLILIELTENKRVGIGA